MGTIFPFEFPFSTGLYLVLYLLTLILHVIFMNYLLAGIFYVFAANVYKALRGAALNELGTAERILTDWLPFALSAAITLGVAPLLFLQILYQRRFYTANLLLFHRWMAILPALIAGFYLLYLLKSKWIEARRHSLRMAVSFGALLCFAFTGWSWTENHLLSLDEKIWPAFYEASSPFYRSEQLLPRYFLWMAGSFPTMAAILLWQFRFGRNAATPVTAQGHRGLARLALGGIGLSALAGALYFYFLDQPARDGLTSKTALPYAFLILLGLAAQVLGWIGPWRGGVITNGGLAIISAGLFLAFLGATVLREAVRLAAIDIQQLYPAHEQAAKEGGFIIFLLFFAVNAFLIAWCFILARRGRIPP